MSKNPRNTPHHEAQRVISDAIEVQSNRLYHVQHQLQLVADVAALAPPAACFGLLLAESVNVTFGAHAETIGSVSTALDQLAAVCRQTLEVSP